MLFFFPIAASFAVEKESTHLVTSERYSRKVVRLVGRQGVCCSQVGRNVQVWRSEGT